MKAQVCGWVSYEWAMARAVYKFCPEIRDTSFSSILLLNSPRMRHIVTLDLFTQPAGDNQ